MVLYNLGGNVIDARLGALLLLVLLSLCSCNRNPEYAPRYTVAVQYSMIAFAPLSSALDHYSLAIMSHRLEVT